MHSRDYAAHEILVAPARGAAELWRLLLGLLVIVLIHIGLNSTLRMLLAAWMPDFWAAEFAEVSQRVDKPLPMLILLGSFGFITVGVAFAARYIQRRRPTSVIGPLPLVLLQFWRVFRMLLIVGLALLLLPPYDMGAPLQRNLDPTTWLLLLPFSLAAVLVQSSAEEILFRGYLQQALAARFSNPLIWLILPSLVFAAGHYLPTQAGGNALLIAIWTGIFGVLMADLTARAGTLGPAIAVHCFNNITALLILSLPDSLSGLSLFTIPYDLSDTENLRRWLYVDFGIMLVSWLAARLAIRR